MSSKSVLSRWRYLVFIPSFYGALTWGGALCLFSLRLLVWEETNPLSMAIFILVEVAFVFSLFTYAPMYRNLAVNRAVIRSEEAIQYTPKVLLLTLHLIGFVGIWKYVMDSSNNLGGIGGFFFALFNESYTIRWAAEDTYSIGTQLSYFGWIAISLTIFEVVRSKISKWWLLIALLQFMLNLMYIDRTRPIWIMFTSLLIVIPTIKKISVGKIIKWVFISMIIAAATFLIIAIWVGKIADEATYGESVLPAPLQTLYAYITCGFPYFNRMTEINEEISYKPVRLLYPLLKVLSSIGVTEAPPSQVIEIYDVPFETNVGTFLEPFYRDGGLGLVIFGIVIYSFGIDAIAYKLLANKNILGVYAWANLCFVSFIGFFTPKIAAFPIWLFCGLGLMSVVLGSFKRIVSFQKHSSII